MKFRVPEPAITALSFVALAGAKQFGTMTSGWPTWAAFSLLLGAGLLTARLIGYDCRLVLLGFGTLFFGMITLECIVLAVGFSVEAMVLWAGTFGLFLFSVVPLIRDAIPRSGEAVGHRWARHPHFKRKG